MKKLALEADWELSNLSHEWKYYLFRRIRRFSNKKDGEGMRISLRKGSLLERDVARMFRLIGFKPQLNARVDGYEIDVLVNIQGRMIAVECKQYERGSLNVSNLIHEWSSKGKVLGFQKVVLVIVGYKVKKEHFELAEKCGVAIWDEEKFEELFSEAIERRLDARDKILLEIGLEPFEGYEEAVKKIKEKIYPLSRKIENSSKNYALLTTLLSFDVSFGWMIAGIVALLSPSLSIVDTGSFWFISLLLLILFTIILRRRNKREKIRGIMTALKEFRAIHERVTPEELASVLPIEADEIKKLFSEVWS